MRSTVDALLFTQADHFLSLPLVIPVYPIGPVDNAAGKALEIGFTFRFQRNDPVEPRSIDRSALLALLL